VSDVRIAASDRDEFGKGASRRFRREGGVPAVMYGSGSPLRHVILPGHELNLALRIPRVVLDIGVDGKRLLVAPRDVQRDPVRLDLLHVDLILLSNKEVDQRHAYADALAKAEATAEEAGHDPLLAAALIEEAAENEQNLEEVASNIVELLEEQEKELRASAAAAAAAEEAAEEAAAVIEEGADEEAADEEGESAE
jgi:large subunit ribosomal protein L25